MFQEESSSVLAGLYLKEATQEVKNDGPPNNLYSLSCLRRVESAHTTVIIFLYKL